MAFTAAQRTKWLGAMLALLVSAQSFAAQGRDPCSGSAFLATNYQWLGIPVMRNARQPAGDAERCLYVVPVSVALTEEWHLKRLAEQGWQSTRRNAIGRDVELEFRNLDRVVRIVISDIDFATAVLIKRPTLAPPDRAE